MRKLYGVFLFGVIVSLLLMILPIQAQDNRAPNLSYNQMGYFTDGPKFAMAPSTASSDEPVEWTLYHAETQQVAASGQTSGAVLDELSQAMIYSADFSAFHTPGRYYLVINGIESRTFRIADSLYQPLSVDALRYFYLNRSGIALEEQYAGQWKRPAGHLTDSAVTCYQGVDADGKVWDGCDYTINGAKGWYDAGDYGKYVVNGGISVWTLLNMYERDRSAFADGSLNIPESGNGVPDVLDEVRWELEFLLGMQIPEGKAQAGMAFHKLHDRKWSGLPLLPPTEYDNDNEHRNPNSGRYVYSPTTAATLNLAAVAAQAARLYRQFDSAFADQCLVAAQRAWQAAQANPKVLAGRVPGEGGGDYPDNVVDDEFYWAAAELYLSTGEEVYRAFLEKSPYWKKFPSADGQLASAMYWGDTAALGTISMVSAESKFTQAERSAFQTQIIRAANRYLTVIETSGYRSPLPLSGLVWGSSSVALNNAIILALAHDFTSDKRYLNGAREVMDYLLGRNALRKSFISGYGENGLLFPHHRFWASAPLRGFPPPPPGAVAGGVNANPSDPGADRAQLAQVPPALRYVDVSESYSTNEVAINWNAPLVWVTHYLSQVK